MINRGWRTLALYLAGLLLLLLGVGAEGYRRTQRETAAAQRDLRDALALADEATAEQGEILGEYGQLLTDAQFAAAQYPLCGALMRAAPDAPPLPTALASSP
jgi:type II secretory pathway pseudopilin PulG